MWVRSFCLHHAFPPFWVSILSKPKVAPVDPPWPHQRNTNQMLIIHAMLWVKAAYSSKTAAAMAPKMLMTELPTADADPVYEVAEVADPELVLVLESEPELDEPLELEEPLPAADPEPELVVFDEVPLV